MSGYLATRWIIGGVGILGALFLVSCSGDPASEGEGPGGARIGLLMETYDVDRWARDQAFFEEKANALGAQVMTQCWYGVGAVRVPSVARPGV